MLLFCGNTANAQPAIVRAVNLIPNPGFESLNNCPSGLNGIAFSPTYTYFPTATNWVAALKNGLPDCFNSCATSTLVKVPTNNYGYSAPNSGNGYAGCYMYYATSTTDYREYLQTKLPVTLSATNYYYLTFFVKLSTYHTGGTLTAIDQLGVHFSVSQVNDSVHNTFLPLSADIVNRSGNYITDTTNWVKIEGIYTGTGGEQWLTLGHFKDTTALPSYTLLGTATGTNICYMYVDDVSIIDIDSSYIIDTLYCAPSFPYKITGTHIAGAYKWNTGATTDTLSVTDTGTYWRKTTYLNTIFWDTIRVQKLQITGGVFNSCKKIFPDSLTGTQPVGKARYKWNTGDTTATLVINDTGKYWRSTTGLPCIQYTDTFKVKLLIDKGWDTTVCVKNFPDTLYGSKIPGTYRWNNDSTKVYTVIYDTGLYWRTTFLPPCTHFTDTIRVKRLQDTGMTTNLCMDIFPVRHLLTITGEAPFNPSTYVWNTGDTTATLLITDTGKYWRITKGLPCTHYTDTVYVHMVHDTGIDTLICNKIFPDTLRPPITIGKKPRYIWNTGDTTATLVVNDTGIYTRHTTAQYCYDYIDTLHVSYTPKPNLGPDSNHCYIDSIVTLAANHTYVRYRWSNGDTTHDTRAQTTGQYILTATDQCGTEKDTINIGFKPPVPLPLARDTSLCQRPPDNRVDTLIPHVVGDSIRWYSDSLGSGSFFQPTIDYNKPGKTTVYVTQTINNCESGKIPILIDVKAYPHVTLGPDTVICKQLPLLIGARNDSFKYAWNTGDSLCCIQPQTSGLYILSATNACGTVYDSIRVNLLNCWKECLWIPDAFTPNGDGKNDKFHLIERCPLSEYYIRIFNRWGELVFLSDNINYSWDAIQMGKPVEPGTYYYMIEFLANITGATHVILKGEVLVIR